MQKQQKKHKCVFTCKIFSKSNVLPPVSFFYMQEQHVKHIFIQKLSIFTCDYLYMYFVYREFIFYMYFVHVFSCFFI